MTTTTARTETWPNASPTSTNWTAQVIYTAPSPRFFTEADIAEGAEVFGAESLNWSELATEAVTESWPVE